MTTYAEIGETFVRALCLSRSLGHVSCAGLADYVGGDDEATLLVVNAFAATRLDHRAEPAQADIDAWLDTAPLASDTMRRGAEAAGRIG